VASKATGTVLAGALIATSFAAMNAQTAENWTTLGANPQRTSWIENDPEISAMQLRAPEFRLLWKNALTGRLGYQGSLSQPVLVQQLTTIKGFKSIAIVGSSSEDVYAIDYDLNRVFWTARLAEGSPSRRGAPNCPISPIPVAWPAPAAGTTATRSSVAYAVTKDGMAHALNPQTGTESKPPVRFVPPNARVTSLIAVETFLYATTSNSCNGAANAIWALDASVGTAQGKKWELDGAVISGFAVGIDGTVYVTTGSAGKESRLANRIVALESKSLRAKGAFTSAEAPFVGPPMVVRHRGRDVVVAATEDRKLYVFDAVSLAATDSAPPLVVATSGWPDYDFRSLASWRSREGTTWVLASLSRSSLREAQSKVSRTDAGSGAIAAFQLVDNETKGLTVRSAWLSRDISSRVAPVILKDVVFALSVIGSATSQRDSADSVLYALDANTGKELWSSGGLIAGASPGVQPVAADGQVYVTTLGGTLYAFGFPREH
jgi:outer membrane protein assembly factor BamB